MTSVYTADSDSTTFEELYRRLRAFPVPLLPPKTACDASLSDAIASLYLHPTIESVLHILNHDLPSAHFLVRHMQSAPAVEGMYVHGLLHRVEGDMNNARAWYADVCADGCFTNFWGPDEVDSSAESEGLHQKDGRWYDAQERKVPSQTRARTFLTEVETIQSCGRPKRDQLEELSRAELDAVLAWCVDRFGTEKCKDATKVWVQPTAEIRGKGQDMVSGGAGYRKF